MKMYLKLITTSGSLMKDVKVTQFKSLQATTLNSQMCQDIKHFFNEAYKIKHVCKAKVKMEKQQASGQFH